jgi:hypothetical protein
LIEKDFSFAKMAKMAAWKNTKANIYFKKWIFKAKLIMLNLAKKKQGNSPPLPKCVEVWLKRIDMALSKRHTYMLYNPL